MNKQWSHAKRYGIPSLTLLFVRLLFQIQFYPDYEAYRGKGGSLHQIWNTLGKTKEERDWK